MTFSAAAVCPETGMLGCVIASSSICVGSRCTFVQTDVGVALTQNVTNPELGSLALEMLANGYHPRAAMDALKAADPHVQWRQLGILGTSGECETFSGQQTLGIHAVAKGRHCVAMGNLLKDSSVPRAMVEALQHSDSRKHLADRLLLALEVGLAAGGEMGPVHSAGLLMCAEVKWPVVNLRVDWHDEPIAELRRIWRQYKPQIGSYVARARDPANAEPYGVPGNE